MTIKSLAVAGAAFISLFSTANAIAAADGPRDEVVAAIDADQEAAIQRLRDWIALPTIANMGINHQEGAEYMAQLARDAGFQHAEIVPTDGVPAVYATLDSGAEHTLGLYFMYDVKHYDPAEWSSPPLAGELVEREGEGMAMIGRGATNQKGPEMAFLNALRAFKESGQKLPVNLVLVAEGEEEIASPNFYQVVTRPDIRAALEKTVGVFIPGTGQTVDGQAGVILGAKGAVEIQLIASGEKWGRGPKGDIHSSLFAIVESPAWRLVKALDTLIAEDGHTPAVEGWFENVQPLTPRQEELIEEGALAGNEDDYKKAIGVEHFYQDEDYVTAMKRLAARPTINIQGLVSGYTGPGGKTILPGRAEAKLDLRLVPDMTKDEMVGKLKAHLEKHGYGDIEVVVSGGYGPTQTPEDSVLIKAQLATYEQAGIPVSLSARAAGSWPGVVFTGPPLNLPANGFGTGRGGGAHAPDEWLLIESDNPKVNGYREMSIFYVDYLYNLAEMAAE